MVRQSLRTPTGRGTSFLGLVVRRAGRQSPSRLSGKGTGPPVAMSPVSGAAIVRRGRVCGWLRVGLGAAQAADCGAQEEVEGGGGGPQGEELPGRLRVLLVPDDGGDGGAAQPLCDQQDSEESLQEVLQEVGEELFHGRVLRAVLTGGGIVGGDGRGGVVAGWETERP